VIGGYIEGLQDGVLKPTPERFKTIHSEIEHLERLVDDLRTLSLVDSGELVIHCQPAVPGDVLERLAETYQHEAGQQKVELKVEIEAGLPDIKVNVERIEQVLSNLVSNALRYSGGGAGGGIIILSARSMRGGVLLGVKDNGSGIAPEVPPHIFERSYRGDSARQGNESGLGLSIAKSIVELHGGRSR